jgi:hydrogenase expression/formation protein HypE
MTIPTQAADVIALKHGSGGRAMRALIEQVFVASSPADSPDLVGLRAMDDGAAVRIDDRWLVVTTDAHVIQPIFFPGGDIGRLAVSGTVNDLAMMGATDVIALTCAVIVEAGFAREDLVRIQASMAATSRGCHAPILAGDTKVMGRGELDGIAITTTGVALTRRIIRDCGLRAGDQVIVTGTIGDHGLAVMAARHGFDLEGDLRSDVAPLNGLIRSALDSPAGQHIVAMKDPTRGGLASALHEMAAKSGVGIVLDEAAVPVAPPAQAAADLLGIDPLLVANEGKAVIGVRADYARVLIDVLRAHPLGRDAAIVGTCVAERPGTIVLDTGFGRRLIAEPDGELLPRIC